MAYFTTLSVAFLAPGFHGKSGAAGGRSSDFQWMAKRSLPIRTMIVETPGSSGLFGNGNTLFWLFFMTTLMPQIGCKRKAS